VAPIEAPMPGRGRVRVFMLAMMPVEGADARRVSDVGGAASAAVATTALIQHPGAASARRHQPFPRVPPGLAYSGGKPALEGRWGTAASSSTRS
jgi:hypothetical protein